jgi:mRNA-degrading endonuclease RelE of RelBE toxin-antitoxin system
VIQTIFTDISAAEMAALSKDLQLELLMEFEILPEDLESLDRSRFGKVRRDGHTLYRCRAGDYRIYFEKHPKGILVNRVLHKNTIRDFLFRSNLPMDEEDEHLGREKGFWKLIDEDDGKKEGENK